MNVNENTQTFFSNIYNKETPLVMKGERNEEWADICPDLLPEDVYCCQRAAVDKIKKEGVLLVVTTTTNSPLIAHYGKKFFLKWDSIHFEEGHYFEECVE